MRLGGGRVDSVNDSEGLKSLFPARTPETRPLSQDDDLAGFSDFNRTEFTLSPPVTSEQRLFHRHSGIHKTTVVSPAQRHPQNNGCFTSTAASLNFKATLYHIF
ncbi:hypothetical protein [Thermincola potens]|uniref:hypothetical protein n=1 Tax=Thermincola potens TaxID=863643 RepID=UPI0012FE509D|nr:hypothetical protein [Thermincola potens]